MKIRKLFVSNSSSSSFIVIGKKPFDDKKWDDFNGSGKLLAGPGSEVYGEYEFGWTPENHVDFHSRLNFAYIQALYSENLKDERVQMIERAVKEVTGLDLVWVPTHDKYDGSVYNGYIDHQSAAYEGRNTQMFDGFTTLKHFLFSDDSLVHTDNDNY